MNLLFVLLVLTSQPRQPQVFYYNGKHLVKLNHIEMPGIRHTTMRIFIYSPYELRDASIDSSEVGLCLPDISVRKDLRLEGRWYIIEWGTDLKVGSTPHTILLNSCRNKVYKEQFFVNVEGTKMIEKPQGVN